MAKILNKQQIITADQIKQAFTVVQKKMQERLNQKGYGTFASLHEISGVITEEYFELIDDVRRESVIGTREELLDIAVDAIFGVACIQADAVEW